MNSFSSNERKSKLLISILVFITVLFNFMFLIGTGYVKQFFLDSIPQYPISVDNRIDNFYRQTEAFANGQLQFLDDTKELQSLNDPYEFTERSSIDYLFDTSYYKGNYYSYYTIIPIVFVLLPIYLISHKFLNLVIVNLLILSLSIYVLSKLYYKIIKDCIPNIPMYLYIIGFLTMIFGSNMFLLLRGLKYDIAVSCGILFLISSIYFLYSILDLKKIKLKFILAGICTAFVVLSKPTYIVYYLLIMYIALNIIKKTNTQKYLFYYIMPIIVIGIFQMNYNYARYDSIFEFGAKYQLTGFNVINYINNASYSRVFRAFKYYICQLPRIDFMQFPYVFMNISYDNKLYDVYLYENLITGLILYPIIILSIILCFGIKKDRILAKLKNCLIVLYIIFFILVIINAIFAGVSEIYSLDFKFMLMIVGVIYILKYIDVVGYKKLLTCVFIICSILNILFILPISYSGEGLCFLDNLKSIRNSHNK